MSEIPPDYESICAAMVAAVDPELRLGGGELSQMASSIARRLTKDGESPEAAVLKMNAVSSVMYSRAGEPYGSGDVARWRWLFELVD